jgi:PKD repeat protein
MRLKAAALGAAFAVVTSLLAGSLAAQTVSLDPAEGAIPAVGESVVLTLKVDNIDGLFGWEVDFAYDNTVLSFVSYAHGDFLSGGGATFDVPTGAPAAFGPDGDGLNETVKVAATLLSGAGVAGAGDLGVITFEVLAASATQVKLEGPKFLDAAVATIDVTAVGSTLTAGAVEPVNEAPVAVAGDDQTVSAGDEVSVDGSASTDDTGVEAYAWDFGDGDTAEGAAATHVFATAGSFAVTLTVTDADGESSTDELTVTVEAVAAAAAIREHTAASPAIQFEAALPTADTAAKAYVVVWEGEITIAAGQQLEYQVRMSSGNPTFNAGVELTTDDGTSLSGTAAVDQNGVAAGPMADLEASARDTWSHRMIALTDLEGQTITQIAVAVDSDTHRAGLYRAYFDNIQITDGEFIVEEIYIDGAELSLATPAEVSTLAAAGGIEGADDATATAGVPAVSVDARGKLSTQWGALKSR